MLTTMKQSKYKVPALEIANKLGVSVAAVRLWRRTGQKPVNPVIAAIYNRIEKGLK